MFIINKVYNCKFVIALESKGYWSKSSVVIGSLRKSYNPTLLKINKIRLYVHVTLKIYFQVINNIKIKK